ncbi:MAG TPA: FKBP-type peptidyl-prolyl cis-trans isomerase [Solirubrobacteraceae bacterium]
MTYSRFFSLRSPTILGLATLAVAVPIAGCGSSSSGGSTIGVNNENSGDSKLATSGTPEPPAPKTPTTGPLSKEPKVTPPAGAAPSKLVVKDLITGTGAEAKAGASVSVNYVGVLFHGGKEFDASWKRNEPFPFKLGAGQVIPGWDQGVVGMRVGGRRELIIPAPLAYGPKGSGSAIPPNAPLVFVIDLLSA